MRGARVATALATGGFNVTVAIGGDLPEGIDFGAARLARLPPVKAGPGGFADLVTPKGEPFDAARRADRRDRLLALFATIAPDILMIEAFPFGRRPMRFELLPLLEAAGTADRPPLVVASVRDILQESRTPGRDAEAVDLVRRHFDHVLVHGDPAFCPLEASFPPAGAIADRLLYGGIVGPPVRVGAAPPVEDFAVIVSVGGGAVGRDLIASALAARPLSAMADTRWLVLAGPNGMATGGPDAPAGVTVRPFEPDLPARLRQARLSISQAGYNTVADLLAAPTCGAVLVPYTAGGETEQARRAAIMARRGWAVSVEAEALSPKALAGAIDRALALPQRTRIPSLDGAAGATACLMTAYAAWRDQSGAPTRSR